MTTLRAWWYARRARKRHQITDLAGWHGGYLCSCGEPWLIRADRCITQPSRNREAR